MKIGVMSDTHDREERIQTAVAKLKARGMGALFHCGDLVSPEMVSLMGKVFLVAGNNDADLEEIRFQVRQQGGEFLGDGGVVQLGNWRVALTHGHLPKVTRQLLEQSPDYLLVGHSHQRDRRWVRQTLVLNPGALHRAKPATCALVDLESGDIEFLEIE